MSVLLFTVLQFQQVAATKGRVRTETTASAAGCREREDLTLAVCSAV